MNEEDIPDTESLKDLIEKRTVPFWKSVVEPQILGKKNILKQLNEILFFSWRNSALCCSWNILERNCKAH